MAVDDSNTKSLLHFNGVDGSTVITDESGKTWTAAGTAQLDTSNPKFGSASLLLDGNSDYISTSPQDDFKVGTGDFTVDMWIYTMSLDTEQALFDWCLLNNESGGGRHDAVIFLLQTSGHLNFFTWDNYRTASAGTIAVNTWTHIVFTRISGVFKYFIDGVLDTNTTTLSVNITSGGTVVGRYGNAAGGYFNGNIDEVRFSNIARWTSSFTPLSSEYLPPDVPPPPVITNKVSPTRAQILG